MPSLPAAGPLRLLAIAGSIALLGFVAALVSCSAAAAKAASMRRGGPKKLHDRALAAAVAWAAAPLLLAATTWMVGRLGLSWAHLGGALATLVVAARNAIRFRGFARFAAAVGAVGWLVAAIAARTLFG